MRTLCGLLLLAAVCLGAWADAPTTRQQIVVTASRIESPALTAPGFITTITADDIAHSSATNLADVIQSATGVEINSSGPEGSLKTVSLQGATSSQVLVLLNGVRLNSSQDGLVDLSQIPLNSIERIEIVRGGDSSLYGTNAIGGVINIITKRPTRDSVTVRLLNGSYLPLGAQEVSSSGTVQAAPADPLALVDTQKLDAEVEKRIGNAGLRAGVSAERAANGYTWFDSTAINGWRTMTNAGYLAGSGSGAITLPIAGGNLDLSGEGGWSNERVPAMITPYLYPSDAAQTDAFANGTLRFQSPNLGELPVATDFRGYYRFRSIDYADPLAVPAFADSQLRNSFGADVTQSAKLSDLLQIGWNGLVSYDAVNSTEIGQRARMNVAGGALVSYTLGGLLTITPALRYDWFNDFGSHLSYSLAGVVPLDAAQALKLVLATSYRAPGLNDLYWPADPYSAGNPNLLPESSYSGQLGYSLRSDRVEGDAYLFSRYTLDQIVWSLDSTDGRYRPQNLGVTFDGGIDARVAFTLARALTLSADYTFLYSLVLADPSGAHTVADNLRVPYSPLHTLTGSLSYALGSQSIGADARIVSEQYSDSANSSSGRIAPTVLLGARYALSLSRGVELQLSAKNLLNQGWVTQPGYVTPPLSFWVQLTVVR